MHYSDIMADVEMKKGIKKLEKVVECSESRVFTVLFRDKQSKEASRVVEGWWS